MAKLELWYAVKPLGINQPFGANPDYYARFKDSFGNPYKGHMGIDFLAPHATPLYAPCDGAAWYQSDSHGGTGIYIRTGPYDYNGGQAYFDIILWHLCSKDDPQYKPLIPLDGTSIPVKTGQLIGYTDNTGAPFESSGDHLHFGLLPTDATGKILEPANGEGGCIDPQPYFNGFFAQDAQATIQNLNTQISIAQKILQLLTAWFKGRNTN